MAWIMESNRWKHLLGGFLIGIAGFGPWTALYAGAVAGGSLELKDKLYGNKWDWWDFLLTLIGAGVAAGGWMIVGN